MNVCVAEHNYCVNNKPPEKDDSRGPYLSSEKPKFWLDYDELVIAVGGYSQTFGIKGVTEYAHFLKGLYISRSLLFQTLF